MSIQTQIDQMAGSGFSVFNLDTTAGGLINMANGKKNVKITESGKDNPKEILVATASKGVAFAKEAIGLNSVIMYADVRESSTLCEHPLEDGSVVVDHQIQQPVEIGLQIVLPQYFFAEIRDELRRLKENGTFVSVHTQGGIYNNMVFRDIPHRESVENQGRLVFECTLKQAPIVKGTDITLTTKKVANATNASTKDSGTKKGRDVSVIEQFLETINELKVKYLG